MLTNSALRAFGILGALAAFASVQACTPSENGDDVKVKVSTKDGISPTSCTARDLAAGTCSLGGGKKGAGRNDYPRPPQGYQVKWTVCTNWVEGDAKLRNNSRIVIADDGGTVVLTRAELLAPGAAGGGKDGGNQLRVKVASLPKGLFGGSGIDRGTGKTVNFLKIGQSIQVKSAKGSTTYVVSSPIGEPTRDAKTNRVEYKDTCYRNPKSTGKDTLGAIMEGYDLSLVCVMEEPLTDYNAVSALYGYFWPIYNYADKDVGMLNDPSGVAHPDNAAFGGTTAGGTFLYKGYSAALNDINGHERDEFLNYYVADDMCHFMNNGGYEVPAAKRIATVSFPAPAADDKSFLLWRPVNRHVDIANKELPAAPDPVEPEPTPEEEEAMAVEEAETAPL